MGYAWRSLFRIDAAPMRKQYIGGGISPLPLSGTSDCVLFAPEAKEYEKIKDVRH